MPACAQENDVGDTVLLITVGPQVLPLFGVLSIIAGVMVTPGATVALLHTGAGVEVLPVTTTTKSLVAVLPAASLNV